MKVASLEIELLANVARLQNDMSRATRTVDGAMQRIERSTAMAMKALGGLAAAFSVRAIAQQVTSITKLASRYNELGIVMNTVGRNAGYTRGELAQLEVDLKKTGISALESRSNIAKLVAANIDLSKATELARLAQDAAVIGGLNSSDAFARLTSGIQSAQVETLRTMGLNANFQKSYEDLAAELGKTTKELTELEKTQARTNAVLALAPTVAGAYEASMTNAGKALRSAERHAEDLQVALGEAFQPAFVVAVDGYSNALKAAIANVDLLKRSMIALTLSTLPLLLAGLTKLAVTVIPMLTARMWSLTAAMLSNPVTAIPTLISMAIAAYVMFDEKLQGTSDFFAKLGALWGVIFEDARKVTEALKDEVARLWGGVKDLTGDTSPKTWTDMLIVGLARVADVASLVIRGLGTMVTVVNSVIKSAEYMAAFIARPDALTRRFAPEEAARLEQEYQDSLKASVDATERAAKSIANLWTEPGNKYEKAAQQIINTQRVVAEEVALVDLTLQKSSENATETAGKANSAYQSLIASIRAKIEENKLEIEVGEKATAADRIRIKVEQDLAAGRLKLSAAQKSVVDQAIRALATSEKELNIARMLQAADKKQLDMSVQAVKSATDEVRKNAELVQTYGMKASAIELLTVARLEDQLARKESLGLSEDEVKALELMIAARKENAALLGSLEWKEAQKQQWEDWASDVEQIFNRVGQSLTDAIFDGGKSGKELLKDMFKGLTFNILINPVMKSLQGMVTNQLGGMFGLQNPQQSGAGGMLQNASSLNNIFGAGYQALTGASVGASTASLGYANLVGAFGGDSIGALISANGGWQGALSGLSSAAGTAAATGAIAGISGAGVALGTTLGSTMATTTFSAALGGGAAAAGGAAAGGMGAAMGAIGAAAPWLAGGLAIGSALGLFGDSEPKTRHGQRTVAEYLDGQYLVTGRDDRVDAGAGEAVAALIEANISQANKIFQQAGIDAAIESFYATMESSVLGDRQGVGSVGTLRIGDAFSQIGIDGGSDMTSRGYGGWSEEDMMSRLVTDVQLSLLDAFQQTGLFSSILDGVNIRGLGQEAAAELSATIQAVVAEVSAFQTAVESLPFENLRDLSFDAAQGLLAAAGGLENLSAGMTTYFQNFYSEQEQVDHAAQQMATAFEGLGQTMPDLSAGAEAAKAAYRGIVESLDVTTEAGQRTFAAMMGLSGSFAQLVAGVDQLADAAARAAEEQSRVAEQLYQAALGNLESTYNAVVQAGQREIAKLQESFAGTDTAMGAYRSKVQEYINSFNGLFSAIDQGVKALRGTGAALEAEYSRARAVISTTLLTGQLPQTADLSDALRVAQQGVTGQVYASRFEQEKAYAILANQMEAIKEIAEPELDAAQATLNQLEDQYRLLRGMSRVGEDSLESLEAQLRTALSTEEAARYQISIVEQQLEATRQQYNALAGIDSTLQDGFQSLASALASFAAAAKAPALSGGGGGGGGAGYRLEGNTLYFPGGGSHSVSGADGAQILIDTYGLEKNGDGSYIRTRARGGYTPPGLTWVGEEGPELVNFKKPGMVYTAGQSAELMSRLTNPQDNSRAVVVELQALRQQNAKLEARLASIEKSTSQLADQFDNVSAGGNALATEVMA